MKSKLLTILILLFALTFCVNSLIAKEIDKESTKAVKSDQSSVIESVTPVTAESNPVVSGDIKTDYSGSKSLAGETIDWYVISSGGGSGSSASYSLVSSIGQTAVGMGTSESFTLFSGFLQDFGTGGGGCCIGMRGDFNGLDGDQPDIADIVFAVEYQFLGSGIAPPCPEEADIAPAGALDGSHDIDDLVSMVEYQFLSGPPPPDC